MESSELKNVKDLDILILVPYPYGLGPSQRFRVEIYEDAMTEAGINWVYQSFLDDKAYLTMYSSGSVLVKAWAFMRGMMKRLSLIVRFGKFDGVIIQREASPLGPPIFEWLVSKVFGLPMIYDIDDAIWLPNFAHANRHFHRLKWYSKVEKSMSWASVVLAGNSFIEKRALMFNDKVEIIPTVVDTENYHSVSSKEPGRRRLRFGWTGSHSTNRHIEYLLPVFMTLRESLEFDLIIISNQRPTMGDFDYEYIPWSRDSEIDDLSKIDIGLMPLIPDFEFAEGKCGFKAIQYMALELPVLLTPIGMNDTLIVHGENGFKCCNLDEWESQLRAILNDEVDLLEVARRGRRTIEAQYSLRSQSSRFVSLVKEAVKSK